MISRFSGRITRGLTSWFTGGTTCGLVRRAHLRVELLVDKKELQMADLMVWPMVVLKVEE